MLFEVTNELVDAIIRNEGRHVGRERKFRLEPRPVPTPNNRATQKPDWIQLPPGMKQPLPSTNT
jgi:hypothetical protein